MENLLTERVVRGRCRKFVFRSNMGKVCLHLPLLQFPPHSDWSSKAASSVLPRAPGSAPQQPVLSEDLVGPQPGGFLTAEIGWTLGVSLFILYCYNYHKLTNLWDQNFISWWFWSLWCSRLSCCCLMKGFLFSPHTVEDRERERQNLHPYVVEENKRMSQSTKVLSIRHQYLMRSKPSWPNHFP